MRVTADTRWHKRALLPAAAVLIALIGGVARGSEAALPIPPQPTALTVTATTATTVSLRWEGSVVDARYGIYRNGTLIGSTAEKTYTVEGLSCGTSYTLGVDAADALGNRSEKTTVTVATAQCPDTQPPTTPGGLAATGQTATSISVRWNASSDNVSVTGYGLYRDGASDGNTPGSLSHTFTGLACGRSYQLGVDAHDAAGNRSARATLSASTSACAPPPPPPPGELPAPGNFRETARTQTSITGAWDAVDGAGGYRVGRDGAALSWRTELEYTWSGLACGRSYSLSVQASRNQSDSTGGTATITASTATCPSPPPPPPPPSGTVKHRGDWETGDRSQWNWGAQCSNTGVPSDSTAVRGTLTVVQDVVVQGSYAARFDLPSAPRNNACEALRKRTLELSEEWYAIEFRLPSDWQEPSGAGWGLDLAQLNYQGIWGAPVMLAAHANTVNLVVQSGLCESVNSSEPGCAYSSGIGGNLPAMYAVPSSRFAKGVWHQLLVRVKWTGGNDGVIQAFHRKAGESAWAQTVSFSGKPTVQWTSGSSPQASHTTADKIGAYRGHSTFPVSVWHDGFCVATTRSAAESCL